MGTSVPSFEGKMPQLREKPREQIIRNGLPRVGHQVPAPIVLKIQRPKEVDLKTLGKINAIGQGAEASNVRVNGTSWAIEEQMDEWMFFAKARIRADTGDWITQITVLQGNTRTQEQLYPEMQGTGREQVTSTRGTKENDQSGIWKLQDESG